jgi:hypothetical protein
VSEGQEIFTFQSVESTRMNESRQMSKSKRQHKIDSSPGSKGNWWPAEKGQSDGFMNVVPRPTWFKTSSQTARQTRTVERLLKRPKPKRDLFVENSFKIVESATEQGSKVMLCDREKVKKIASWRRPFVSGGRCGVNAQILRMPSLSDKQVSFH